jgi:hypothetical protein
MKRPHPLYHFDPEFKPRPKLVESRSSNWPFAIGILIASAITLGAVALAVYLTWGFWQ